MDGISTGVALVVSFFLGILGIISDQIFYSLCLFSMVGSTLATQIFNFPPAKIYAGDSGSLFYGLTLSSLAIIVTNSFNSTPFDGNNFKLLGILFLIFIYPIYDTTLVVTIRLVNSYPPWLGDTNHSTHRLSRLGYSTKFISLAIILMQFLTCLAIFFLLENSDLYNFTAMILIILFWLVPFIYLFVQPYNDPRSQ